jgi:hypothetical protein
MNQIQDTFFNFCLKNCEGCINRRASQKDHPCLMDAEFYKRYLNDSATNKTLQRYDGGDEQKIILSNK